MIPYSVKNGKPPKFKLRNPEVFNEGMYQRA